MITWLLASCIRLTLIFAVLITVFNAIGRLFPSDQLVYYTREHHLRFLHLDRHLTVIGAHLAPSDPNNHIGLTAAGRWLLYENHERVFIREIATLRTRDLTRLFGIQDADQVVGLPTGDRLVYLDRFHRLFYVDFQTDQWRHINETRNALIGTPSPDGQKILYSQGGEIYLTDFTCTTRLSWEDRQFVDDLQWSTDSARLIWHDQDQSAVIEVETAFDGAEYTVTDIFPYSIGSVWRSSNEVLGYDERSASRFWLNVVTGTRTPYLCPTNDPFYDRFIPKLFNDQAVVFFDPPHLIRCDHHTHTSENMDFSLYGTRFHELITWRVIR
ncbi:MAG: hypothetical protein MUF87_18815 [Anaerolineae bacterium]|nr:hypothetical protein [Anaerolineae bacterium]